MTQLCRGCKRELPKEQPDCHVCGAPQGLVRYYRKMFLVVLILLCAFGVFEYWLLEQYNNIKEQRIERQLAEKYQADEKKITELESLLVASKSNLAKSNEQLESAEKNATQSGSKASERVDKLQQQLKNVQAKSDKAEQRARWLSKENVSLKKQLAELQSALKNQSQSQAINKASLNAELAELKQQAVSLQAQLDSKKQQFELSWQQDNGALSANASPELQEQKRKALTQFTSNETQALQALEDKSRAIEQKLAQSN